MDQPGKSSSPTAATEPSVFVPVERWIQAFGHLQAAVNPLGLVDLTNPEKMAAEAVEASGQMGARVLELCHTRDELLETSRKLLETVIWMSGSEDFGPTGKAGMGWRITKPLLAAAQASIDAAEARR